MKEFDSYIIIYLNMLLGAEYLLCCLGEIEGTPIYRHSLKQAANRFKAELEKLTDEDLSKLWGIEDSSMYNLMGHQDTLLKQLAKMRPENYGVLVKMIERYNQNPAAFQVWLGEKIIEKEEVA